LSKNVISAFNEIPLAFEFFLGRQNPIFLPKKFQRIPRVRCVISLFRSAEEKEIFLLGGGPPSKDFWSEPFSLHKKFVGKKILAEGETFFVGH
jgi:hypothetical protein